MLHESRFTILVREWVRPWVTANELVGSICGKSEVVLEWVKARISSNKLVFVSLSKGGILGWGGLKCRWNQVKCFMERQK